MIDQRPMISFPRFPGWLPGSEKNRGGRKLLCGCDFLSVPRFPSM